MTRLLTFVLLQLFFCDLPKVNSEFMISYSYISTFMGKKKLAFLQISLCRKPRNFQTTD